MKTIKDKEQAIIKEFSVFSSWEDKYKHLIQFGKKLHPLGEEFKTEKFRIKGCQSQVWLHATFNDGKVIYKADSDALIVKGIAGLLVEAYSESTPDEILSNNGDFLNEVGITNHLSMNRSNGLSSMLKSIKLYATAFKALSSK